MADFNAKDFLELVRKSGIVAEDRLRQSLTELSQKAAGRPIRTLELSQHLMDAGLITRWHYEKLSAGKYKGFFLGQYKLLGHIGSGGMSAIYLAEHKLSQHRRAIKVLPRHRVADKSYLDRFYREGRSAAALNHPNIVRIYDLCSESDTHYMVMEYVEGIDLHQWVKQIGPLEYQSALQYIRQAAEGLVHAHGRNLVHRDIKPANLLLNKEGMVKILDLGLALMQDELESITILHNERVMGTADYLSPEQAINSHNVDHRTDIYSLGGTLYFLLTGHPPFPKGSIAQRIAMHQSRDPDPITNDRPDCPSQIVDLCQQMMRKKPEDRFPDCKELIRTIKRIEYALFGSTDLIPPPDFTAAMATATDAAAAALPSPADAVAEAAIDDARPGKSDPPAKAQLNALVSANEPRDPVVHPAPPLTAPPSKQSTAAPKKLAVAPEKLSERNPTSADSPKIAGMIQSDFQVIAQDFSALSNTEITAPPQPIRRKPTKKKSGTLLYLITGSMFLLLIVTLILTLMFLG